MSSAEKGPVSHEELAELLREAYRRFSEEMRAGGFAKRAGFGRNPAVVAVDLIKGFTAPRCSQGTALFDPAVLASRALLDVARERSVPVVLIGSAYDRAGREGGAWERKLSHHDLFHGTEWVEFDERLGQTDGDQVIYKHYPSAFFATDLASRLVSQGIDTVLITGVSTSGCIRATAVDACCHGFRSIVVADAVADRSPLPHVANLFDIEMKYGDVVSLAEAIAYLEGRTRNPRPTRRSNTP
jgi:nicotinamidase-related amidase